MSDLISDILEKLDRVRKYKKRKKAIAEDEGNLSVYKRLSQEIEGIEESMEVVGSCAFSGESEPINSEELYEEALEKWGEGPQNDMAIEECGELITALAKRKRWINGSTKEDVKDEIIDVEVTIEQLKLLYFDSELEHREMKRGALMYLRDLLEEENEEEAE